MHRQANSGEYCEVKVKYSSTYFITQHSSPTHRYIKTSYLPVRLEDILSIEESLLPSHCFPSHLSIASIHQDVLSPASFRQTNAQVGPKHFTPLVGGGSKSGYVHLWRIINIIT